MSDRTEGGAKELDFSSHLLLTFARALTPHGLALRGGFNFEPSEHAPDGPGGKPATAVLLVGQVGRAAWEPFKTWRAGKPPDLPDPLDTWSREVIGGVAALVGARAVWPNDRPFLPFQRWAMRAERLRPSPLGILMHPVFGLWHAYRAALLFDRPIPLPPTSAAPHPCDACLEKPCLSVCPANAYSSAGFAAAACRSHLGTPDGWACMSVGCMARNACQVGTEFRYSPEQQAFHMQSFVRP